MDYIKQISYNTLGNVTTLFFQWLIIMLIPKITDFSEAGLFAVAISVASILNQISLFTLNQYQVADQYEHYSENDFAVARLFTVTLSFLCIVPVMFIFGYDVNQTLIIIAYTVYRNLINYAQLHLASLQIADRLDYAGKCMILEGIVSFFVFVGLYYVFGNLLTATTMMAIVGGGIFLYAMAEGYRKQFGHRYGLDISKRDKLVPLLKIGLPLMLSTLMPIIITALPKLILEANHGTEIVGFFSTLTSPTIIIPTMAIAVFTPFIVMFSNLCKNGDLKGLRKRFLIILGILTIMGFICFIISVLFAGPVFKMIYGESIIPYVRYFDILIVGIFLYSAGVCGQMILVTKNQGKFSGIMSVISLILSAVIFLAWIPADGMNGATWGLMAAYGMYGAFMAICAYALPLNNRSRMKDS